MIFLLDTTVLIDYLRGAPVVDRVDEILDRGDELCTTAINVEEVSRGLGTNDDEAAQRLIEGLLIVSLGAPEGWRAGRWRRDFSREGVTLTQADCLIAAAVFAAGATLATGNPKDFPMGEIEVEDWPVGE